jgi:hypothetical protein
MQNDKVFLLPLLDPGTRADGDLAVPIAGDQGSLGFQASSAGERGNRGELIGVLTDGTDVEGWPESAGSGARAARPDP